MLRTMRRLAFALLAVGAVACSNDDNGTGANANGSMSASIGGTAWNANLSVAASRAGNVLAIAGVSSDQRQINITIPNVTTTGTVNLGVGQQGVATITLGTQAWVTSLVGGTGSVSITTLTANRAAGTFTFTAAASTNTGATGTKAVTSGAFDVNF